MFLYLCVLGGGGGGVTHALACVCGPKYETNSSLQEPVAFLVQCYLRSHKTPKAAWVQDVWSQICVCARQTAVSLTMEQLVQGETDEGRTTCYILLMCVCVCVCAVLSVECFCCQECVPEYVVRVL